MDQVDIGKFIAACRKEKELTQVQLAEKLNITDRAVSKWETGKSMPDSSIMLELCEILGISVNELLSGEKINMDEYDKKADENLIELKRKDENNIKKNIVISIVCSVTLLIAIFVCAICDFATSGTLTWSLIPISSIIFGWVMSFPVITLGKRGIVGSMVSMSIFVIPYLYVLSMLVKVYTVFRIGTIMSIISMIYIWLIFVLYNRLRARKLLMIGIALLLSIPFVFIVNIILSKMISEPVIDMWDILSVFVLLVVAFAFFVYDHFKQTGQNKPK